MTSSFKSLLSVISTLLLLLTSISSSAADTVITAAYPSFDSANIQAFQLNGNAALDGTALKLTDAAGNQAGSAFWKYKTTLYNSRSFSAFFSFSMTNAGGGGADGIVFTIQPLSNTAGTAGGGIGYDGIAQSLGVEFDTWLNGGATADPNANHVGIDVNGSVTSVATADAGSVGTLDDGSTYYAWIDYTSATTTIEVRLSTTTSRPASALLTHVIDLSAIFPQDVYVGFTAATGGAWAKHSILNFYFNNNFISEGITPDTIPYVSAPYRVTAFATPASTAADGTSQSVVTATVYDVSATPIPNTLVSFTTNLGAVTASATTDSSGQAQAAVVSDTAGSATVRASVTGGAYGETSVEFTVPNATPVPTSTPTATPTTTPTATPTPPPATPQLAISHKRPPYNYRVFMRCRGPEGISIDKYAFNLYQTFRKHRHLVIRRKKASSSYTAPIPGFGNYRGSCRYHTKNGWSSYGWSRQIHVR